MAADSHGAEMGQKPRAAPGRVGLRGKSIRMGQGAAEDMLRSSHLGAQVVTEE